jgi:hypothetical protein
LGDLFIAQPKNVFGGCRGEDHLLKVIPIERAKFIGEGHGDLALGYEPHFFIAISALHHPRDTVVVLEVLVVGGFVPDPEADEHDYGHAYGKPGDIYKRKQFVCPEAAPGDLYIVLEHAGGFDGMLHRRCQDCKDLIMMILKWGL